MSKLLLPLLCVALIAWLIGSTLWFDKNYASSSTKDPGWQIVDGEALISSCPSIFAFQQSDNDVIISPEQEEVLVAVAGYLNTHGERQLTLTGIFHATEKNHSEHQNLGLARAETIRSLLIRKGAEMAQVQVGFKEVERLPLNDNALISGGVEFVFSALPKEDYGVAEKRQTVTQKWEI